MLCFCCCYCLWATLAFSFQQMRGRGHLLFGQGSLGQHVFGHVCMAPTPMCQPAAAKMHAYICAYKQGEVMKHESVQRTSTCGRQVQVISHHVHCINGSEHVLALFCTCATSPCCLLEVRCDERSVLSWPPAKHMLSLQASWVWGGPDKLHRDRCRMVVVFQQLQCIQS